MTIDEIKAKLEKLDEERDRILNEIAKRRQDMKRFAGQLTASVAQAERAKITDLQDLLEDVEFDIGEIFDKLFEAVGDQIFTDPEEEIGRLIDAEEPAADKEDLERKYRNALKDLDIYKAARAAKQAELNELDDLIESTELEIDELLGQLKPAE